MLQRSTMSLQRVPELQLAGKGLRPLMNRGSYPTPVNINIKSYNNRVYFYSKIHTLFEQKETHNKLKFQIIVTQLSSSYHETNSLFF